MKGGIFLLQGNKLVGLNETQYEVESLLQELLANYPDLLVGSQVDPISPRRWLHVARESGIPGEEGGSGRWSLDHLFLDQDGVPTLVEVKRSTDTRIRREVVGQMLDYAANSVVYWPAITIRTQFERTCELTGTDPNQALVDFLGEGSEPEEFWQSTDLNLHAGRIRMIFVADVIPLELQRIVEFLNGQMNPAQILAIEVPQYRSEDGLAAFAPRVVGQTAAAQQSKNSGPRHSGVSDRESFLADVGARTTSESLKVMETLINWAEERNLQIEYKEGVRHGGANFLTRNHLQEFVPIAGLWSGNDVPVHVKVSSLDKFAPWVTNGRKASIVMAAEQLPDFRRTPKGIDPIVTCDRIAAANATSQLIDVLQTILDTVTEDSSQDSASLS